MEGNQYEISVEELMIKAEEDPFADVSDNDNDSSYDYDSQTQSSKRSYDFFNAESVDVMEKPLKVSKSYSESVPQTTSHRFFVTSTSAATSTSSDTSFVNLKSALFDGKFYKMIKETNGNNLKAECQICAPIKKFIRGKTTSTTNFLSHIRKMHPAAYKEYLAYKEMKKKEVRIIEVIDPEKTNEIKIPERKIIQKKQQTDTKISNTQKTWCLEQNEFDRRIINFILGTTSGMLLLDNPYFVQLFDGLDVKVLTRNTAVKKISNLCDNYLNSIKSMLENINHVCITIDIWSSNTGSFLAMTCHWINEKFERKSIVLTCRRFNTSKNCNLGEILDEVFEKFGFTNAEVTETVTNNGLNLTRVIQDNCFHLDNEILIHDIRGMSQDEDMTKEESDNLCERLYFPNNEATNKLCSNIYLQPQMQSISQIITLIALTDIIKAINVNQNLMMKHRIILNKCCELWNKAGKLKSTEIIQNILGHNLIYPGVTNWKTYFNAISQLVEDKEKINILLAKLNIKSTIAEKEFIYLEEYILILKPLAQAFDILQSEHNAYFGVVIPTIASMKIKYEKMQSNNFKYLGPLVETCLTSILMRFNDFLTLSTDALSATVATTTHPKFKLRWLTLFKDTLCVINADIIQKKIIDEACDFEAQSKTVLLATEEVSPLDVILEKEFFEFEDNESSVDDLGCLNKQGRMQFLRYLEDSNTSLRMLDNYPLIKKLFLKYNTVLPSSACVEKLFSCTTFLNLPNPGELYNTNIENLMLLKTNKVLSE